MQSIHQINVLREHIQAAKREGKTVGFVPTMGNLHDGHISLVNAARAASDLVVSSIFVNPLQFGQNEDLDKYPKTLAADQQQLSDLGCDLLFAPSVDEMYSGGAIATRVEVGGVSELHCGASRPGHFAGVATVVAKLFAIVQPDRAFFGEKDYQQLTVIRRMTADLSLPIDIIGIPTVRNTEGLALSSRNGYLSDAQRQQAPALYRTLQHLQQQISAGERDYPQLQQVACDTLAAAGFQPDYLHICNAHTLQPATARDRELVILAAAQLGPARLIDNIRFDI